MAERMVDASAGLASLARSVRYRLEAAGVASAPLDARLLVCAATGVTHEQFIANPDRLLHDHEADMLNQFVARRISREPVSRIVGCREFWGREFRITPETLDPRSDSETLVETVLQHLAVSKCSAPLIVDLGTGSGCLLVTLLCEMSHARGVGVDINAGAIAMARENAHMHGVDARVSFLCGDWLAAIDGQFDLIISNPPYIRSDDIVGLEPEVKFFEPYCALDGGADGLECYRRISKEVIGKLKNGGKLVFELGMGQHAAVVDILETAGYRIDGAHEDLSGTVRCLWATPRR